MAPNTTSTAGAEGQAKPVLSGGSHTARQEKGIALKAKLVQSDFFFDLFHIPFQLLFPECLANAWA